MTSRREFLQLAAAATLGFRGLHTLCADPAFTTARLTTGLGYGPLIPDPAGILDLPAGFTYRIISRRGDEMDDGLLVPGDPDGMAAFPGPDGKVILVRNHELDTTERRGSPFGRKLDRLDRVHERHVYDLGHRRKPCLGGTTTLLYNPSTGQVERQFMSLIGTQNNCAGGPTPWGSWISCEETTQRADEHFEHDHGFNFEVPATLTGHPVEPVPLKAMGRFRHEAIAVDPASGIVYQTEDLPDGLIYRFIPHVPERLAADGRLQALAIIDQPSCDTRNWLADSGPPAATPIPLAVPMPTRWIDLENVESPDDSLRHQGFANGAARFARAEGMWYGNDGVYFACTNGGRAQKGQIWKYTPSPAEGTPNESARPGRLVLFVEPNDPGIVDNADNLTVAPWGDLVVCEDGSGDQFIVGVTPGGGFYRIARNARNHSEFAGCTFSPDGRTLFFNVQYSGETFAVTGHWAARAAT